MQNRMLDRLEEETGRAQDQANVITQHTQVRLR